MFSFLKKSVDTESLLVSRIWGRLLDLTFALAQRPSTRTTFEKIASTKKTQPAHRDDASKNFS